jgi:hypothetical protein
MTTYKPTDVWTLEDDLIFLKYCPSKRDRCFHMMARDTGTRTHELLKLKIKDVVLIQQVETGQWYAEVTVNGKTGSRSLPMFYSIPYYKAWLEQDHPVKGNPNAPLFCGAQNKKNFGRRLSRGGMYKIYTVYKEQYFPKLAQQDPTVPEEDKKKIRALLEKPWNPYLVHRHTTLTKLAREKGLADSFLENIAGWKLGSNMKQKYVHLHANEGSRALLKVWGVDLDSSSSNESEKHQTAVAIINNDKLKPKSCPNCNEVNEASAKFCSNPKCGMILTFEGYKTAVENSQRKENEMEEMKARLDSFEQVEEDRKEHEAELHETIHDMISRMDNMLIKMYEVNPAMPSLPTKELQDTFASIVGKDVEELRQQRQQQQKQQ